jgi:hypothetical protein
MDCYPPPLPVVDHWDYVPVFADEGACHDSWLRHRMGPGLFETPRDYAGYRAAGTLERLLDVALFVSVEKGHVSTLSVPAADGLIAAVYGPDGPPVGPST